MCVRSQFLATVALMGLVLGLVPSAFVRAETPTLFSTLRAGDLIRGESFSAVYYYGEDGFRYVFPNDKTYFTWYSDFDDVILVSDADLATIQMGGNVTYRPGVKMIKINSDPKTYAIDEGGVLRWVTTEEVAVGMLGDEWNTMIDDVPDGFFGNYVMGTDLETVEDAQTFQMQFLSHDDWTITDDKGLVDYTEVMIEGMEYSGTATIAVGETVRWTNNDSVNHTATADDDSWGTGTIKPGGSFVRRFDEPGTYTYFCSYHPEMTGTIVVEDAVIDCGTGDTSSSCGG